MSFSILGTGKAVPEYVLTNDELSTMVETNDEWIKTRTGIEERRVCKDETLTDLTVRAARDALGNAGIEPAQLDLIICSTMRGENITPSQACVIQKEIGADCPAFDVNAACSGFIYALDIADGYFVRKKVKHVLVVSMDNLSNITDWTDRSTCVLFGDGAGAAVLTEGDNIKGTKLHSQPDVDKIWMSRKLVPSPYVTTPDLEVPLQMKGREVFRFAVEACTNGVKRLLDEVGIKKDDVSWFMVHQANKRIIDSIIDFMQVPSERFPVNIHDHGNSSSASCPILLDECNRKGMFKEGDIIVLSAFGAGLLSGAAVLEW